MVDTTASELIENHTLAYGQSVILNKFPTVVDGLKRSHIRILWSLRDDHGPRNTDQLVSATRGIHPHGDASIFKTVVRMSQSFNYSPTILTYHGEVGSYSGDNPAAGRYTEISTSDFAKDVFFKDIDLKALEKQLLPNLHDYEPVSFVPALPTALILSNVTLGFGFSSKTASLNLRNVCDLTVAYIKHMKAYPTREFDYLPHIEKLIPDFPLDGAIINYEQLLNAYKKGDFKKPILMEGTVNLSSSMIRIRTLGFGNPFKDIEENINEKRKDKKENWFNKNIISVDDISEDMCFGDLQIVVKKTVNIFEAWSIISKFVGYTSAFHPVPNYTTKEGFIKECSYINILYEWYQKRYNILLGTKKYQLTRLTNDIRQIEALLIVCDTKEKTDRVIHVMRSNDTIDGGAKILCAEFNISSYQARYLYDAGFKTLVTAVKEELLQKYEELKQKRLVLKESFSFVPEEMIETLQIIKKKHGIDRITLIAEYIGYVKIGMGCIQFRTIDEIYEILKNFSRETCEIYLYEGNYKLAYDFNNKQINANVKILTGVIYNLKKSPESIYTVWLNDQSGCVVSGFIHDKDNQNLLYTSRDSNVIYRDGTLSTVDITKELTKRKTISSGIQTKIIYAYPVTKSPITYIAIFSTTTPNLIVLHKVTADTKKIAINPTGTLKILSTVNDEWFINIDKSFVQRVAVNTLYIKDLAAFFEDKTQIRIDLAKNSVKSNKILEFL
jgi:DNA gyrase/topoisomerase IV, subunit A